MPVSYLYDEAARAQTNGADRATQDDGRRTLTVYEEFTLGAARHPSETEAYLVTRVLAYCLEHEEGIAFSEGISATEAPAVLVRDLATDSSDQGRSETSPPR